MSEPRIFDGTHSTRTIHALMHWLASTPHSEARLSDRDSDWVLMHSIVNNQYRCIAKVRVDMWNYAIEHGWIKPRNKVFDRRYYRLTRNAQRAGRQKGYTFREHRF
jgi:hypothetical protein